MQQTHSDGRGDGVQTVEQGLRALAIGADILVQAVRDDAPLLALHTMAAPLVSIANQTLSLMNEEDERASGVESVKEMAEEFARHAYDGAPKHKLNLWAQTLNEQMKDLEQ